jgi:RNA polymerase sigma factor (sigma-70 family)
MSVFGSVSRWIQELKSGDSDAPTHLWNRYHPDLMRITRRRLYGMSRRVADEEDLVVTAFQSFFRRAREGQFPQLSRRDHMWALLLTITNRKVINNLRRQLSRKRGGSQPSCAATSAAGMEIHGEGVLNQVECFDLAPDVEARVMELLDAVDDELRWMLYLRQEGLTNTEIASRLDRSVATVERRLRLLREKCEKELQG